MHSYNRGQHIPIVATFRNTSNEIVNGSTANTATITVSYGDMPTTTSLADMPWPFDGSDRLTVQSTMTINSTVAGVTTASWIYTFASGVASTGEIFWSAVSGTGGYVQEGRFQLVGNLANPVSVPTTF